MVTHFFIEGMIILIYVALGGTEEGGKAKWICSLTEEAVHHAKLCIKERV